jgi:hypothetical protein
MKVRERIVLRGWVNGSGFSFEEIYENRIVEVVEIPSDEKKFDWSWWEKTGPTIIIGAYSDIKITVEYYDFVTDTLLAEFSIWESEL